MRRAQAAVAFVAVAMVLGCVALMVEAGRRIYHSIGPSKAVASADGSLYVLSHGKLHIFAPDGTRRAAIPFESIGLARTPSDLALHGDGRAVFADPDTSLLQRCRLPAGPCEALDLQLRRSDLQKVVPLNSIKVAIDEAAQRYYVSDNAGHQAVIADFSGKVLARSRPYEFWYPNHLFVPARGELAVVDTNHHRIATVDVHLDRFGPELRSVPAGASDAGRSGRVWPFDAARMPDGRMVMLVAANGMKDADVIVAEGASRRRIDLGADSDPFDLEWWNGRVVVADATNYRLVAAGADGRVSRDFPPPDFRDELEREREGPAFWRAARLGAQAGLVLVPLAAILFLWRLGVPLGPTRPQTWSAPADGRASPDVGTLACVPAYLARQRKALMVAAFLLVVAAVLMSGLLAVRFSASAAALPWRRLVPVIVLMIATIAFVALAWRRARTVHAALRLESHPARLEVMYPSFAARARRIPIAWRDVYWDGRTLLAGRLLIMVRMARGTAMFEREAFERFILSRIPKANRVKPGRLWLLALRAKNPQAILVTVALALVVVMQLVRLGRHL